MSLLIVDACPRGEGLSRTLKLLDAFLQGYQGERQLLRLADCALTPYDGAMVERREALIQAGRIQEPLFALARQFAQASQVLIAAPYWDLSFPSVLKVYIEHIFARTITFVYEENGPVGLCQARRMGLLTSAGGAIPKGLNLGGSYLRAAGNMLGIREFHQVTAQGLDVEGAPMEAILASACRRARRLGQTFSS